MIMTRGNKYDLVCDPPERGTPIELDLSGTDVTHVKSVTGCFYEVTRDGFVGIYNPGDAQRVPLEDFVTFYPVEGIKFRKLPQAGDKS